jgi:hypothetical protein
VSTGLRPANDGPGGVFGPPGPFSLGARLTGNHSRTRFALAFAANRDAGHLTGPAKGLVMRTGHANVRVGVRTEPVRRKDCPVCGSVFFPSEPPARRRVLQSALGCASTADALSD